MCIKEEKSLRFFPVMLNNDPVDDELQSHKAHIRTEFTNVDLFLRKHNVVPSL